MTHTQPRPLPCLLALALITTSTLAKNSSDWLSWRAPNGNTAIPADDYPVSWSAEKNVAWKVALPDIGNSSPIVAGKRVFITQSIAKTKQRGIICYDTDTGKKRWENFVTQDTDEKTHRTNPYCSSSPTVSGNTVITWLGNSGMFAFSLDGKKLWHKDLGPVHHVFGYGSSPVIHNNICYLNFGPGKSTFVVALDVKTGKELWRTPVTVDLEKYGNKIEGSYATPIFVPNKTGKIELITTFPGYIVSLDPATGKENWRCGGLDYNVHGSPAALGDVIVAFGGYQYESIAVRMGGKGNVTDSHRLWQHKKMNAISTPVFAGKHFYRVGKNFASCHETTTGKELWRERFSETPTWASPILVDDLIYIVDQNGTTTVYKARPDKFEIVSVNKTEDVLTNGSLAFANKAVYLRTHKALWKFTKQN